MSKLRSDALDDSRRVGASTLVREPHIDQLRIARVEMLEHSALDEAELRQQGLHRTVGLISGGPELGVGRRSRDAVLQQRSCDAAAPLAPLDLQHLDEGRPEET